MAEIMETIDLSDHAVIKQEIEDTFSNDEEEPVGCINPYLSSKHEQVENEPCTPVMLELHSQHLSSTTSHMKEPVEETYHATTPNSSYNSEGILGPTTIICFPEQPDLGSGFCQLHSTTDDNKDVKTAQLLFSGQHAEEDTAPCCVNSFNTYLNPEVALGRPGESNFSIPSCHSEDDTTLILNMFQDAAKPHKCSVCKKGFSTNKYLTIHKRIHNGDKPHVCELCKKAFCQKSHLNKHRKTHTGEKPYTCDICQKMFSQNSSLKIHTRLHNDENPYECDLCHKNFPRKFQLDLHRVAHSNEKPYECDTCKKTFSHLFHFNSHLKIHSGVIYECDECNKSFSRKYYYNLHKKIHKGETPYECGICNKKFSQGWHLKRHSSTHSNEKPLHCDVSIKIELE